MIKLKSNICYLFKNPKRIGRYLGTRLNNYTDEPEEHIFMSDKGLRFAIEPKFKDYIELKSNLAKLLYLK